MALCAAMLEDQHSDDASMPRIELIHPVFDARNPWFKVFHGMCNYPQCDFLLKIQIHSGDNSISIRSDQ